MSDEPSIEERLRLLESHAEVQSESLTHLFAERIEAERLATSVARLGDGADSLAVALQKVDEQQQALTRLGREIKRVEAASATSVEVQNARRRSEYVTREKAEELRKERRREVVKLVSYVTVCCTVLLCLVFYTSNSSYTACVNRQRATMAVRDTLATFHNPGAPDSRITDGIDRMNATLTESCSSQYLLHF